MDPTILTLVAFLTAVSLVGLIAVVTQNSDDSAESRLNTFEREPAIGDEEDSLFEDSDRKGVLAVIFPFLDDKTRRQMGERLVQAGIYQRNSPLSYVTLKLLVIVVPIGLAFFAHLSGLASPIEAFLFAAITGIAGTIAPGFYLDHLRSARQTTLRRALPDALDVIIVCVEGGLSLPAAFAKVGTELSTAHPLLATEMLIVRREIQMGRSTGEALRNFAQRFDMEELRGLSSVVLQAERFGASVVRAMRIFADSLREKRMLRAEELAAQATVKILFPTLFCIFPALFVVILGPAVYDILDYFDKLGLR